MKAWHFVSGTLRDGTATPKDGVPLIHTGLVEICFSGLHASERIIDALQYAPGNTICRVECGDVVDSQDDKLVCRSRTILWRLDSEEVLRDFARKCALDVAHLWDMPPIVREYLETGREDSRAAASAAASVASNANVASDAAWDAARAAGTASTSRATNTFSVASDAAWDVASDAAWDAASAAARTAPRTARDAAWDAARDEQNKVLTALVNEARS